MLLERVCDSFFTVTSRALLFDGPALFLKPALREERAISTLEFAIMLPVIIIFSLGITDFGLMLQKNQLLADAARQGAFQTSRRAWSNINCERVDGPISCDVALLNPPTNSSRIEEVASFNTCQVLQRNNLDVRHWEVVVSRELAHEQLDGVLMDFPALGINVSLKDDELGCVVCASWPVNTSWFGKQIIWGAADYPLNNVTCA